MNAGERKKHYLIPAAYASLSKNSFLSVMHFFKKLRLISDIIGVSSRMSEIFFMSILGKIRFSAAVQSSLYSESRSLNSVC